MVQGNGLEQQNGGHNMHEVRFNFGFYRFYLFVGIVLSFLLCPFYEFSALQY